MAFLGDRFNLLQKDHDPFIIQILSYIVEDIICRKFDIDFSIYVIKVYSIIIAIIWHLKYI